MRTPQLIGVVVMAMVPLAACNQSDTREQARVAAAEVKEVAGRAGDQLADSWLATKIQAQYFADSDVKARNILVSARDGVVTLRGVVDSQNGHDQALQIARSTDGVTSVQDQLSGPASSSSLAVATSGIAPATLPEVADRLNDAGVTATIQSKFFVDASIKARRIEVDTRKGVVTLRGEVASDDERAQALILARTTEGVDRVEDALSVNLGLAQPADPASVSAAAPAATNAAAAVETRDHSLRQQIESRLAAEQVFNAAPIEVTTKDGVVLIEGSVPSLALKQRALSVVSGTEGVLQVVDRLSVVKQRAR